MAFCIEISELYIKQLGIYPEMIQKRGKQYHYFLLNKTNYVDFKPVKWGYRTYFIAYTYISEVHDLRQYLFIHVIIKRVKTWQDIVKYISNKATFCI